MVARTIIGKHRPHFGRVQARPQRELRDLTRHRTQLVEEKTLTINRIQKVLEDGNIKLASVASDVMGVSGRSMIERLIEGETDPHKLADLAQKQLRGKITEPPLKRFGDKQKSGTHCIARTKARKYVSDSMPDDRFATIAVEFETLQKQLQVSTDSAERKALLEEIFSLLEEMDRLVKRHLSEFSD